MIIADALSNQKSCRVRAHFQNSNDGNGGFQISLQNDRKTSHKMYLLSATAGIIIVIITLMHFVKRNVKKVNSDGKCVLITGCDSGVGLSLAIFSNFLGFHVIATCLDTSSSGAQLMVEKYPMILVLQMDVTRSDDVRKTRELVETYLIQTKSQLWGLINNAGVLIYGQFDWQTESQIINQVQVNLIGVMRVTKAFIPLIRNARGTKYFIPPRWNVMVHHCS